MVLALDDRLIPAPATRLTELDEPLSTKFVATGEEIEIV
jgi:hypothetical protein